MRALLPIGIISFLGVAMASAAGCSASITIPGTAPHPAGTGFAGPNGVIVWGSSCSGSVYYADGSGFAFCDAGVWDYTLTNPSGDGYTLYSGGSGGDGGASGGDGGASGGDGGASGGDGGASGGDGGASGGDGGASGGDGGGASGGDGGGAGGGG